MDVIKNTSIILPVNDLDEAERMTIADLYTGFDDPIHALDCGKKCSPYNENGVPFCCDTRHAIPTAYQEEWDYLESHTDLWHLWSSEGPGEDSRLQKQLARGQVLIACQGHTHCQRGFRSLTCRSFPFFPYLDRAGSFIGLSYYWLYEDRCWVISNLGVVSGEYRSQFIQAYEFLFKRYPDERENFAHQSAVMRRFFATHKRTIPLLHRNGAFYKISPGSGRMRCVPAESLPKYGPYKIAAQLPFPDES